MPRCTSIYPRYRRHKASGQATVTIGGRDIYLGTYGTKASKIEYDRVIGEWLAAGRHLPGSQLGDISIAELIERFMDHALAYYRDGAGEPTGEAEKFKAPLAILARLYGRTDAAAFGPLALEAVRIGMLGNGWTRGYINTRIARLKMVFKWGVSRELIPASVHQALATLPALRRGKTTAPEADPVLPIADAIVEATLPHLPRIPRAMVQLQRLTGARPSEICNMRIGEIDRSTDPWQYAPERHKTQNHGKARIIHIGPRAQEVLRDFLMRLDPQAFVFSPTAAVAEFNRERSENRKTPLSCGNKPGSNIVKRRERKREPGECYGRDEYRRAIARACDAAFPPPSDLARARLPWGASSTKAETVAAWKARLGSRWPELQKWQREHRWHPHQLRHAAATEARAKFGLEGAQHMLGHASLSVTEIYAERSQAAAAAVAKAIG